MKSPQSKQKGRILKVKNGYNPNSSSIGSEIMTYLFFAGGAGVLSVILSNTMVSIKSAIDKNKDKIVSSKDDR